MTLVKRGFFEQYDISEHQHQEELLCATNLVQPLPSQTHFQNIKLT